MRKKISMLELLLSDLGLFIGRIPGPVSPSHATGDTVAVCLGGQSWGSASSSFPLPLVLDQQGENMLYSLTASSFMKFAFLPPVGELKLEWTRRAPILP